MTLYFLSACVFVLINLSVITFLESFIIISSESLYQLNSRISLELRVECWEERERETAALRRSWNWRAMKTINFDYSETNSSVKYQVDQDQSRKISDSSSQLFPVIPIPWTNQTWYFFSQAAFLFSIHDNFDFFQRNFGDHLVLNRRQYPKIYLKIVFYVQNFSWIQDKTEVCYYCDPLTGPVMRLTLTLTRLPSWSCQHVDSWLSACSYKQLLLHCGFTGCWTISLLY